MLSQPFNAPYLLGGVCYRYPPVETALAGGYYCALRLRLGVLLFAFHSDLEFI